MKLVAKSLIASAVLAASSFAAPTFAADVSANLGFNSEYYYRGILQKASSANGGFDVEAGGFYAGVWGADVGEGLEIDLYGGYTFEATEDLSFTVGFTDYEYTGEFDTFYREINLGLDYKFLSVGYSDGVQGVDGDDDNKYGFLEVTLSHNGFYGTYGTYSKDAEGNYFEFGYGATVSDIDLGAAIILSSEELSDQVDEDGDATSSQAFVFSISKTFDL
ncbi:TorF family putative porin [Simiduia sp. 21SJ11W-1]|uniref:TorF family putative porin n=1 Tax=Simiduia sp. 21SJ11W-1 TaxID=2909669 RepID=UPI0020A1213A|nr:TorF family putative porin [Simiduia sp. 21SJ11W-1]UTA48065.1 TorF family putative porin [Simiduia sp. 21SJ11W-1]